MNDAGDLFLFEIDSEPEHVGIAIWSPRTGWRHRWARRNGAFKTVEANVPKDDNNDER